MKILIVEPYFTGSHAAWAEGYRKKSRHSVEILSLPGRFWKWRMHGGAVTLAQRFLSQGLRPDLIVATDMLDLTAFLALTRPLSDGIPAAIYFHENQITYPWPEADRDRARGRDGHYGFINFVSALAADAVFFNSCFHMESFLDGLERFLRAFPDYSCSSSVGEIRDKSVVLYVGMDFDALDRAGCGADADVRTGAPLILWNHRWEEDKNPADFFRALYALDERGLEFEAAILGENFSRSPAVFEEARERLGRRVAHYGFVKDYGEYAGWLKRADILPVTSEHDFFGCSVVEAMYCGVYPILPRRLAYPEHFAPHGRAHGVQGRRGDDRRVRGAGDGDFFYDDFSGLVERLERAVGAIDETRRKAALLRGRVIRYGWDRMAGVYDDAMERTARGGGAMAE